MRVLLGLALGALCAIAIACGGAKKEAAAPGPVMATDAGRPPVMAGPRGEIEELSRQIDADLATLGIPPQVVPASACIQPPCDAVTLSTDLTAPHTDDPSCKPAPSETCQSSCRLSDSICSNAGKICSLARDLGGSDTYANGKCASGKTSCETARGRCCGCQL